MRFGFVDFTRTYEPRLVNAYVIAQQAQLRTQYAACYDGDGSADDVIILSRDIHENADPRDPKAIADVRSHALVDRLIAVVDRAPIEGAAGVHDLTACWIFADVAKETGARWTTIGSHEVLEARRDPRLRACIELEDGTISDVEICDRVESESYTLGGVYLSNFNTPECFEPPPGWESQVGGKVASPLPVTTGAILIRRGLFDWMGTSRAPNEVRPGGYRQRLDPSRGWITEGTPSAYRARIAELGLGRGAARRARGAR